MLRNASVTTAPIRCISGSHPHLYGSHDDNLPNVTHRR